MCELHHSELFQQTHASRQSTATMRQPLHPESHPKSKSSTAVHIISQQHYYYSQQSQQRYCCIIMVIPHSQDHSHSNKNIPLGWGYVVATSGTKGVARSVLVDPLHEEAHHANHRSWYTMYWDVRMAEIVSGELDRMWSTLSIFESRLLES